MTTLSAFQAAFSAVALLLGLHWLLTSDIRRLLYRINGATYRWAVMIGRDRRTGIEKQFAPRVLRRVV